MKGTVDYIKSNFIRFIELMFVIAALFVTQQMNIKSQGEVQERMLHENRVMATIVQELVVSVATIQANQMNMKEDVKVLERKHD